MRKYLWMLCSLMAVLLLTACSNQKASSAQKKECYYAIAKIDGVWVITDSKDRTAETEDQNLLRGEMTAHGAAIAVQETEESGQKQRKYGAIDLSGKTMIPFVYEEMRYSDVINCIAVKMEGLWGLLSYEGEMILPCEYEYIQMEEAYEMISLRKDSKWGYLDKNGQKVTPIQYDATLPVIAEWLDDPEDPLQRELLCVSMGGKYGFINRKGEEVIPCKYESAYIFTEGLAQVGMNGRYGFINEKGEEVIPCRYYSTDVAFQEGYVWAGTGDQTCFLDAKGETVFVYERSVPVIPHFSEGLAEIRDDGCGYIDTSGELVIPCEYDQGEAFMGGAALVKKGADYLVIDTQGNRISGFSEYDRILMRVTENTFKVMKEGYVGYADKDGSVLVPCEYEDIYLYDKVNLLAQVKKDGLFGIVDVKTGEILLEPQYEYLEKAVTIAPKM